MYMYYTDLRISMKGNLILSGVAGKNKPSLIKPQEQLKQEKVTTTTYACRLIKTKYNVVVPENDIQACHYLPKPSWFGFETERKGPPGITSQLRSRREGRMRLVCMPIFNLLTRETA